MRMVRPLTFIFTLLGMIPSSAPAANAATRNVACSGDITSALSAAVSASANEDIVNIGAGSCSMGGVTISDKNITIQGAGQGVTKIAAQSRIRAMDHDRLE